MRLAQREPYSLQERETIRLQVFQHLTRGMLRLLSELDHLELSLSNDNQRYAELVRNAGDLHDGEPFPTPLYHALSSLWDDPNVQVVWKDRETYDFPARLVIKFQSTKAKMTTVCAGSASRTSFPPWIDSSISRIRQQIKTY